MEKVFDDLRVNIIKVNNVTKVAYIAIVHNFKK